MTRHQTRSNGLSHVKPKRRKKVKQVQEFGFFDSEKPEDSFHKRRFFDDEPRHIVVETKNTAAAPMVIGVMLAGMLIGIATLVFLWKSESRFAGPLDKQTVQQGASDG